MLVESVERCGDVVVFELSDDWTGRKDGLAAKIEIFVQGSHIGFHMGNQVLIVDEDADVISPADRQLSGCRENVLGSWHEA